MLAHLPTLPPPPAVGGAAQDPGTVSAAMVAVVVGALLLIVGGGLLRVVGGLRRDRAVGRTFLAPDAHPLASDDGLLLDAVALFLAVQQAWDARDDATLERLLGPELLRAWRAHADDFSAMGWRSRVRVTGRPTARLEQPPSDDDGVAVVLMSCDVLSWVTTDDGTRVLRDGSGRGGVRLRQRWTLERRDAGGWTVTAVDDERGSR